MIGPGQNIKPAVALLVIVDTDGVAHGWNVQPITKSSWEMIGIEGGRTKVRVVLEGALHRKSIQVEPAPGGSLTMESLTFGELE